MAGVLLPSKGLKSYGRYGAVGFELILSIAIGYYIGHWLDGKLGTRWLALVGFLVGCYAGFRALFRTAKQMQLDIEREEKLERGVDPWGTEYEAPESDEQADEGGTKPS
jgi:F0F1-type ATP synthase assembly protein I